MSVKYLFYRKTLIALTRDKNSPIYDPVWAKKYEDKIKDLQ